MTLALRLAALLLLICAPARAYEIETRAGVICDTRQQAERVAVPLDDDERSAIGTVNAEARDPTACVVADVAYVRGAKAGTARSRARTFDVVEVLVVGVVTQVGVRPAKPAPYFMLFQVDERDA
jgi:hypothetical protein